MAFKKCLNCKSSFEAKGTKVYCHKEIEAKCKICDIIFIAKCETQIRKTCSKSCSGKLIRKEQGIKNKKPCKNCGDEFEPRNQIAIFCNKDVIAECRSCKTKFTRPCTPHHGKSFCTTSCRNTYMRKENYQISIKRNCKICSKEFTPLTSKQIMCCWDSFTISCEFCEALFHPAYTRYKAGIAKYCDNVCSTLAQMDSKISFDKIEEYKNPEKWCFDFRDRFGRKPEIGDWAAYFNSSVPKFAPRKLFKKTKSSGWEMQIIQYIEKSYPNLEYNRRRKIDTDEGKREIDILIPSLNLGIEVQDFSTHSKSSESDIGPFGLKRGPAYHQHKIENAKKLGIQLIEIWEDEILNKSFKEKLDTIIRQKKEDENND